MAAIINTQSGLLEGLSRPGVLEFRGIPYAAPPTGETRFLPPRPHPGWAGVRSAHTFSSPAPQELSPVMGVDRVSDDCLYLNIWTPATDALRRPVLVWLHGGSFLSGSGHQPLYHGATLARTQDCVVVTCNYRLGVFGFGNMAAVLGEHFPAATNLGLRDQVAVLQWVQENIAAFGGDPQCVTLFGESAGGMSVAALLAVPAARGLFHRAIVQSGGADFVVSPDDAARVTDIALAALAPDASARCDALLHGEVGAIVRAQRRSLKETVDRGMRGQTPQYGMPFLPVVDGDFLPERPIDAIAGGAAREIPLLASVTRDEWNLFVHQPAFAGGKNEKAEQLDDARLRHVLERALPGRGDAALAFYRHSRGRRDNGMRVDAFCWMESDRMFRVPTHRLLQAQSWHRPDTFAAQFNWENPQAGGVLGACHVVDVPFVFGNTATPVGQYFTGGGERAQQLSESVMAAWGSFARFGKPASVEGVEWTPYGAECRAMQLGAKVAIGPMPEADVAGFWQFLN